MSRILCLSILFSVILQFGAAASICSRREFSFLDDDLNQKCPAWIEPSPPIEASGEILDILLVNDRGRTYYSVLFYASWCPFSRIVRPTFHTLSSMFPQINHVAVEESTALPSIFSRYGVRSFPSLLLVKGRNRVLYYGPKDLGSLVEFYKEITGLKPVTNFVGDQLDSGALRASSPWSGSPREIISSEPYLVFGLCFICLRALLWFMPKIFYHLKAFSDTYFWSYMKFDLVGESSRLLEHALHAIDIKKLWSKIKICKLKNFKKGAKNAGAWASSLASVSLGESSSRTSADS